MADKSLRNKAVNISDKQYVQVKDRIIFFNDTYANGKIETALLTPPESQHVAFKAYVYPDMKQPERFFTGYSQAVVGKGMVNTTAAMENAETSAVGRALAMMGIGLIDQVASVDEMRKANPPLKPQPNPPQKKQNYFDMAKLAITAQTNPDALKEMRAKIAKAKAYTQAEQHQLLKLIDAKGV